jgi:hypothetical protein
MKKRVSSRDNSTDTAYLRDEKTAGIEKTNKSTPRMINGMKRIFTILYAVFFIITPLLHLADIPRLFSEN